MWLAVGYFTVVAACLLAPGPLTFFGIEGGFFAIKLAEPVMKRFGIKFVLSNSLQQSIEGAAGGMVLVLTIGIFAFWLRSKFRSLYSAVEIGVGGFVGLFAVSGYSGIVTLGEHSKVILSLLTGVYIVVRGLDNFDKSLTQDTAIRHVFDKYLLLKR